MKKDFNSTIDLDELIDINKQLSELVRTEISVINEYGTDKFYYKILFKDLGAEIIEKMKI